MSAGQSRPRNCSLIGIALAAAILAGCRTDSVGSYTAAIDNAASPPDGISAEEQTVLNYRISDLQPNQRPMLNSDEDGLWMLVDRMESDIRTAGNRIHDPALNAYLQKVTCRVAGSHCSAIRIYLMRVPAFNASMAPNGMMMIWSGLLLRAQNEAQVAAVIGHEVGHFLRRHSVQRMRNIIEQTNSLTFVQFFLAGAGAGAAGGLLQLAALGSIQSFSRDNEREADGYGILLMREAGYDPREASKVWSRLGRERSAIKEQNNSVPFLASHPASEERESVLKRLGERLQTPTATDTGRDRFLEATLPFRAGLLRDELHRRQYDSFAALIDILMEDGANPAELHYFKGEMHRLRDGKGDAMSALDAYQAAKSAPGIAPADIDRSVALAYRKAGKPEEARAALRRYLDSNPNAPDSAMIRQMLSH